MDADLRKKLEMFRSSTENQPNSHSLPEAKDIIKYLNTECSQAEDANLHSAPTLNKINNTFAHAPKDTTQKQVQFRSRNVAMATTHTSPHQSSHSTGIKKPTHWQCFACNSNEHKIYACSVFQNKSPHERHNLVKENHRCVSCLGHHNLKDCHSQTSCRTCNKKHHTLLHFPAPLVDQNHFKPVNANVSYPHEPTQTSMTSTSQDHSQPPFKSSTILLGTFLIKVTSGQGTSHVFRALLDSGSMCDLITERAAQLLNARRYKSNVQLSGLGQNAAKSNGQTYLNLETLSGFLISPQHPMLILDKLTVDLPRVPVSPEVLSLTKRFCLADPSFHLPGRIDIVLGCSLFPKLLTHENYSLGQHMPHVIGTHFGYIVMGSAPCEIPTNSTPQCSNLISHTISLHSSNDVDLHSSLQRFWTQEELPNCQKKTEEEELCDANFESTHTRDSEGRYIVRLPFKEAHPPLGASQPLAERRFHSLERKFAVQPRFSQIYHDFIDDYISLDHMTICQDSLLPSSHYFLPHHGVLKESSSTTKLRTVVDASAKTSTGVSLNDILLTGRKLQSNICDILMHFRRHNIVFSCDIRQMYRQIQIHPDDRKFQLILWRETSSQPLTAYQLNTVTYGMNSSPYLAIKTLHPLADDEGDYFPEAAQLLRMQTYVDDIITGADTEETALKLQDQLVNLLRRGGFELRKWVSNSDRLLQAFPKEHLETPVFLQDSEQPHFTILGLHWSPHSDCFTHNLNFPMDPHPSKRSILSIIAKIYDPCGFLAPCIMQAKCFMQLLWTTGLSWDDPLPTNLAEKWHSFLIDTQYLSQISIPRALQFSLSCTVELHGFADASESGYAAVVYFRCQMSNGDTIIHPIISKTRVSPLKRVTLPRLELCAAHLLAQLVAHCHSLFSDKIAIKNIYLWSDSSIVLTWLRTPPYKLKTYVANRVSQTQELVPIDSWRHISSTDNTADCASRGISASLLVNHPLWWTGPPWLKLPTCHWPTSHFIPEDLSSSEEIKKTPLVVLTSAPQKEWELLSAYSSWNKLQRIVALLNRFIHTCRHQNDRLSGPLSSSEISKALSRSSIMFHKPPLQMK
ncbi:uncharacterized protein LOC128989543 [Macrosteles quadrilineatus]|uniref:uncharacterized protein LOC128989543 n=1 Tax=Macrosteles quadrilineatus TaxID=74068 RepID=UPI0023E30B70|nr:uncharacterized protein LOC128989543 [Macrosteles quadrilineatus]